MSIADYSVFVRMESVLVTVDTRGRIAKSRRTPTPGASAHVVLVTHVRLLMRVTVALAPSQETATRSASARFLLAALLSVQQECLSRRA